MRRVAHRRALGHSAAGTPDMAVRIPVSASAAMDRGLRRGDRGSGVHLCAGGRFCVYRGHRGAKDMDGVLFRRFGVRIPTTDAGGGYAAGGAFAEGVRLKLKSFCP